MKRYIRSNRKVEARFVHIHGKMIHSQHMIINFSKCVCVNTIFLSSVFFIFVCDYYKSVYCFLKRVSERTNAFVFPLPVVYFFGFSEIPANQGFILFLHISTAQDNKTTNKFSLCASAVADSGALYVCFND